MQLNAAGVIKRCPVLEMPAEEWERVIRVNLTGLFLCSQAAGKHMAERQVGAASSTSPRAGASHRPEAGIPLRRFQGRSDHLHEDAGHGVGALHRHRQPPSDPAPPRPTWPGRACPEEQWTLKQSTSPLMGGFTQKEEITGLIRYLISDAARYISGQLFLLRTA